MLAAVQIYGHLLLHSAPELKNDAEIVTKAVE